MRQYRKASHSVYDIKYHIALQEEEQGLVGNHAFGPAHPGGGRVRFSDSTMPLEPNTSTRWSYP
jgi:hypothetical protein